MAASCIGTASADSAPMLRFTQPHFYLTQGSAQRLYGCIAFTNLSAVAIKRVDFSIDFRDASGKSLAHQLYTMSGNFAPNVVIEPPHNPNHDGMGPTCWEYYAPRQPTGLDMRAVRVEFADGSVWPGASPTPAASPSPLASPRFYE